MAFRALSILFIILYPLGNLLAQETGTKDYPSLGLSFTIPDGWVGQEMEEGYLMGSETESGLILLIPHEVTNLENLKQEARSGVNEEGISLALNGSLANFGNNGIGGEYSGVLQGTRAKGYLIGLINPHGGYGLTIMALTDEPNYGPQYKGFAEKVAQNIRFYEVKIPPVVLEWQDKLKGSKLTYLSSYSSGGSGSSSRTTIHLCIDGSFSFSSSSSLSIDVGGAFGSSSGNDSGTGLWEVIPNSYGGPQLNLNFQDGKQYNYDITIEGNNETHLNGRRYFLTYDPQCY